MLQGLTFLISVVKYAFSLEYGSKAACKMVDLSSPRKLKCFKAEREALSRLDHPNIIRLLHCTQKNNVGYLFLDYLTAQSLEDVLKSGKCFSEVETRQIMSQLLSALKYCRSKNVYHHDIKPENIMIDRGNVIWLIDFGLSITTDTDDGSLVEEFSGSPYYMAPEIFTKQPFDPLLSDIWSFGVCMYILLCQDVPFSARTYKELKKKVLTAPVQYPRDLSPAAKDLLQRILVTDPEDRISLEEIDEHPWFANKRKILTCSYLCGNPSD